MKGIFSLRKLKLIFLNIIVVRIDPPEQLFLQREAPLLGIVRVAVQLTDRREKPVSYFAESS